jgi:alkylation response protein AidB-like acyl-CoA dehydrogenase
MWARAGRCIDWALNYVRERGGGKDSYRQLRFGELKSMIDAARLTLYTAARMFKKDPENAMLAAHEAKWMAKETLQKVMWSAAEVCGRHRSSKITRSRDSIAICICT